MEWQQSQIEKDAAEQVDIYIMQAWYNRKTWKTGH